jgi:hypothetical protein
MATVTVVMMAEMVVVVAAAAAAAAVLLRAPSCRSSRGDEFGVGGACRPGPVVALQVIHHSARAPALYYIQVVQLLLQ